MNIVVAAPLWPPRSLVGSWLSTHELAVAATERGHHVDVVQLLADEPYHHDGLDVHGRDALSDRVAAADLVISHSGDDRRAHHLALKRGVPSVRLVHGPNASAGDLAGAALTVFNSAASQTASRWAGPSIIVAPPVWPERYTTSRGDAVTLVNLSVAKGGQVLWSLARRMPNRRFLGVRGGYGHQIMRRAPNVRILAPTPDMRSVYGSTRILLMPSAKETYGRVGIEAMCSGIPVIAHPTPGLVEALGPAATFVDRHDLAGWVAAIDALDDPDTYTAASAAATAHAATLDPVADCARFVDAIEQAAA